MPSIFALMSGGLWPASPFLLVGVLCAATAWWQIARILLALPPCASLIARELARARLVPPAATVGCLDQAASHRERGRDRRKGPAGSPNRNGYSREAHNYRI